MLNPLSRLRHAPLTPRRLGLALLALVLALYLIGVPLLDQAELKAYDMRLLASLANQSEPAVAIVAIDEQSLAAEGHWPWSRATLARLVEQLDRLGAKVIAFDVFFRSRKTRPRSISSRASSANPAATARPAACASCSPPTRSWRRRSRAAARWCCRLCS